MESQNFALCTVVSNAKKEGCVMLLNVEDVFELVGEEIFIEVNQDSV
jgi:hypothetical protein